jgi:hypothetical protein
MWTMALTVLKFFGGIFSTLWNLITKYPVQCLVVVALLVLLWFVDKWAVARTTTKLNKEHAVYVGKVETLAEERRKKIEEIEASSKLAGEEAKATIESQSRAISSIAATYEKRLEEAQKTKKIEYVYIKVPGAFAPQTELIVENGLVACRRFPSQFTDVVNEIVDQANKRASK